MNMINTSRAKRRIIEAYEIVSQVHGNGTDVQRVVNHLRLKLDQNGGHSWVRRVLKEYKSQKKL